MMPLHPAGRGRRPQSTAGTLLTAATLLLAGVLYISRRPSRMASGGPDGEKLPLMSASGIQIHQDVPDAALRVAEQADSQRKEPLGRKEGPYEKHPITGTSFEQLKAEMAEHSEHLEHPGVTEHETMEEEEEGKEEKNKSVGETEVPSEAEAETQAEKNSLRGEDEGGDKEGEKSKSGDKANEEQNDSHSGDGGGEEKVKDDKVDTKEEDDDSSKSTAKDEEENKSAKPSDARTYEEDSKHDGDDEVEEKHSGKGKKATADEEEERSEEAEEGEDPSGATMVDGVALAGHFKMMLHRQVVWQLPGQTDQGGKKGRRARGRAAGERFPGSIKSGREMQETAEEGNEGEGDGKTGKGESEGEEGDEGAGRRGEGREDSRRDGKGESAGDRGDDSEEAESGRGRSAAGAAVRGVLFLAHGCSHRATHFWPRHETLCPECAGLPEDMRIVAAALKRGYAAVAISSQDNCWDDSWPPASSPDVVTVRSILSAWREEHQLPASLPVAAFGASSGGYFVSVLAHAMPLSALVIQIASGVPAAFHNEMKGDEKFPPTLFVHMPKDERTARRVSRSMAVLRAKGCETGELKCGEQPIHEKDFARRIPGMSAGQSRELFGLLQKENVIDGDGRVVEDGRRSAWRQAVEKEAESSKEGPLADWHRFEAGIEEELNVAFAYHELTAEYVEEQMDWVENVCREPGEPEARSGRCRL